MVSSETEIRRSGKCYVIWYTQFGAQVSINTWWYLIGVFVQFSEFNDELASRLEGKNVFHI